MERVYCQFCEQTFITGKLEKCSLCGKSGGLTRLEQPDQPLSDAATGDDDPLLRNLARQAPPAPLAWRPPNSWSIELRRAEARGLDLPPVCMRCGQPAEQFVSKVFAWHPSWVYFLLFVGLLPFIIVALIITERARVDAPLCAVHKGHWSKRTWTLLLSFLAVVAIGIGGAVLIGNQRQGESVTSVVCIGCVVLLAVWVMLAVLVQGTAIRPLEITSDAIRLTHVSPAFVEAVQAQRELRRTGRPDYAADEGIMDALPVRRPPPTDAFEEHK